MSRVLSYREYRKMRPSDFQNEDVIEIHAVIWLMDGKEIRFYIDPENRMTAEETAHNGDLVADGEAAIKGICPQAAHGRHYCC